MYLFHIFINQWYPIQPLKKQPPSRFHTIGLLLVIAAIFLSVGNCFILYSSLSALLFVISGLMPTNSTGLRDLVYLAPFPELCSISRFLTSLLIPQYRELSTQRTRYTTQLFSFIVETWCAKDFRLITTIRIGLIFRFYPPASFALNPRFFNSVIKLSL